MGAFSKTWGTNDAAFYTNLTKYIGACIENKEKPSQANRDPEVQKLAFWLSNQRAKLKSGKMPIDRVAALQIFLNWAMPNGTQTMEEWLEQADEIIDHYESKILKGDGFSHEELTEAKGFMEQRSNMSTDDLAKEKAEGKGKGQKRGRKPAKKESHVEEKPVDLIAAGYVAPPAPWADKTKGMKTWNEREKGIETEVKHETMAQKMAKNLLEMVKETEGITTRAVRTRDYNFRLRLSPEDIDVLDRCYFDNKDEVYEQLAKLHWQSDRMKYLAALGISIDGVYNIVNTFSREYLGYRVLIRKTSKKTPNLHEPIRVKDGVVLNPLTCWGGRCGYNE